MIENSNKNSLNFDFIYTSINDFWKADNNFDFRDSNTKMFDIFQQDAGQFMSCNQAMEENFAVNTKMNNKQQKAEKNEEVEFEVREENVQSVESILSNISAFLIQGQFDSTLNFLEEKTSILLSSNQMIKLTLRKLDLFKNVATNNMEVAAKSLESLKSTLKALNLLNFRKSDYIDCLVEYPEVLKSRFYNLFKQNDYVQNLIKVINFEILGTDSFFSGANAMEGKPLDFKKITEANNILKNIEDELIFYQASFNKSKHICDNFDEFMFNSGTTYDSNSVLSNNLIIEEFLYELISKKNENSKILLFSQKKDISNNQNKKKETIFKTNTVILKPSQEKIQKKTNSIIEEKAKNVKYSSLKSYNFKTVKRENLDKKIIRKFRRYLSLRLSDIPNSDKLSQIFIKFSSNELFPPFTYENKIFKSFNTSYLIWIFENKDISTYYNEYIELNLDNMIQFLSNTFKIEDSQELFLLENYLKNMVYIYSNFEKIIQSKIEEPIKNLEILELKDEKKYHEARMSIERNFMCLSVENFPGMRDSNKVYDNTSEKNRLISKMFDDYDINIDC